MIAQPLPYHGWRTDRFRQGIFSDHTLMTGLVEDAYEYPEQTTGLGILTFLSGMGECFLNHRREKLADRAWMLMDRGSRLSLHLAGAGTRPVLLFFHTQLVEKLWRHGSFAPLERVHMGQLNFRSQLEELVTLGDSCGSFVALKADAIVRHILETLIRQARQANLYAERLEVAKPSTRIELYRRLSAAKDHVQVHYASALTLESMAEVAMLNRQHFLRMFRQCFGLTPHQFLTETRLEAAKQRLLHSDDSITLICQQVGFESLSSFSGLCRQYLGVSPVVWRRSQRSMN